MTYVEDDPIMISAPQHYVFFEWEGALILNERVWDRKFQTAEAVSCMSGRMNRIGNPGGMFGSICGTSQTWAVEKAE